MDPHGYTEDACRSTEVLLMRHPQTVANVSKRYLGQRNAPLTELGESQRRRAEDALVAYAPQRIVCSPLDRCLAVAKPAADRLGVDLLVEPDIIEMGFGVLENHTYAEAVAEGMCFPWGETADSWPVEGAESLEALCDRTARAAARIAALEGRTAVVSHGGAIRGICAAWLSLAPQAIWELVISNVASAIFQFDAAQVPYLLAFGLTPEQVAERGYPEGGGCIMQDSKETSS